MATSKRKKHRIKTRSSNVNDINNKKEKNTHKQVAIEATVERDRKWLGCRKEDASIRISLLIITSVIYFNSLKCNFVYDDHKAILENPDVIDSSPASWLRLFQNDFWGTPISNPGSHKSYRPLVTLSFKTQYQLAKLYRMFRGEHFDNVIAPATTEQPEVALPFHLLNILLHVLAVDLVYRVACCLLTIEPIHLNDCNKKSAFSTRAILSNRAAASIASLLFSCHPIHVEAVTSLVGRAELMGSLFALLSFESLIGYLSCEKKCDQNEYLNEDSKNRIQDSKLKLVSSMVFAICACFSKENCATVIIINLIFIIYTHLKRRDLYERSLRSFIAMSSLLVAFVALRYQLTSTSPLPKFSKLDNPLAQSAESLCRQLKIEDCHLPEVVNQVNQWKLMTRLYLPAFSFELLANPMSELSYDWPLETIGVIKSPFEMRFILALSGYFVVVSILVKWLIGLLGTYIESLDTKRAPDQTSRQRRVSSYLVDEQLNDYCDKLQTNHSNKEKQQHQQPLSRSDSSTNFISDSEYGSDSETNSLKSVDTLRSNDSGFLGSELKFHEPPQSASPAPSTSSSGVSTLGSQISSTIGGGGEDNETRNLPVTPTRTPDIELNLLDRLGWSLVWLLVPYLPASNLVLPVGFLVAERTLYLASFGFCLLFSNLLFMAMQLWYQFASREQQMVSKTAGNHNGFLIWLWTLTLRFGSKKITSTRWPLTQIEPAEKVERKMGTKRHELASDDSFKTTNLLLVLLPSIAVLPLLILGATKTMDRNEDWRNDLSLYQSNLRQSPAKSLANLATLNSISPGVSLNLDESIELYRKALELEQNSAELHYNLALALQQQNSKSRVGADVPTSSIKGSGSFIVGSESRSLKQDNIDKLDPIEYHYKFAIQLRGGNFPLAALNLGAHQYGKGQLVEAEQTYDRCAFEMDAQNSKQQTAHILAQIECLISAVRLHHQSPDIKLDHDAKQTMDSKQTFIGGVGGRQVCEAKASKRLREARLLANEIRAQVSELEAEDRGLNYRLGDKQTLELNKQSASINWLAAKCEPEVGRRNAMLKVAAEFALRSQVSSSAEIYLDYATATLRDDSSRLNFLLKAIEIESLKLNVNLEQVARLHVGLVTKLKLDAPTREAHMKEALRLTPKNPDYLKLAAEFAYDKGDHLLSESLYRESLENLLELKARGNQVSSERLSLAHVNLGAILQVRGRLRESEQQYRQALGVNAKNSIAKQNLASVTRKLAAEIAAN